MKKKKGLIAGIVILLILIGVYIGLKVAGPKEKEEQTEEKEITAFEVEVENISQVSIENDGVLYTFVKEEDTWKYAEDENLPLNQDIISNIISGLTSVKAQRELTDVENFADYGLSEPKLRATITAKNNEQTVLNFGDDNEAISGTYMSIGNNEKIYLVNSSSEPKLRATITAKNNEQTVLNFGDDNEAISGTYMSIGNNEKIYLVNSSLKTDLQFEKNDLAKMEELPQIAVGNIKKIEISSESGVKTLQEEEVGGLWTLYKEDRRKKLEDYGLYIRKTEVKYL